MGLIELIDPIMMYVHTNSFSMIPVSRWPGPGGPFGGPVPVPSWNPLLREVVWPPLPLPPCPPPLLVLLILKVPISKFPIDGKLLLDPFI